MQLHSEGTNKVTNTFLQSVSGIVGRYWVFLCSQAKVRPRISTFKNIMSVFFFFVFLLEVNRSIDVCTVAAKGPV